MALLTTEQAAARLGVSGRTVYTMVEEGQLKRVPFGKRWRFRSEDIDRYAEGRQPVRKAQKAEAVAA